MTAVQAPEERRSFRAFTAVSALIGFVALAVAGAQLTPSQDPLEVFGFHSAVIPLTGLALFVVARSPLIMSGLRAEVSILLDTTTYVVVAHIVPFNVAVQCVAVGMVVACWSLPMNTLVRIAHFGAATATWAAVIALKPMLTGSLTGFPGLLVTTLSLGVLGEVGTLAVVALTARFSRGRSAVALFRGSAGIETVVGLAQGALACLTIEIIRDAPAAAALLAVPIGMLMVISRGLIRSQMANVRSSVLSEAVLRLQQCSDPEAILTEAVDHAARMLRSRHVEYTDRPVGKGELVGEVTRPDGTRLRFVAQRRTTGERFRNEDQQALTALASTASAALRALELISTMRWRAMHDALTELPNRAYFLELADEALEQRQPDELVTVFFVDLDGFKQVNDTLGHETGDTLLRETATRLSEIMHAPNAVARLGGDEFCVLLRDVTDRAEIDEIIETICARVAEPVVVDGRNAIVGASIGVAVAPEDGETTSTLMRVADERMYARKHLRRAANKAVTEPVLHVEGLLVNGAA